MRFLERLRQLIPRPFKFIQRKLDIEQEWQQLKLNLRPHKYKITIVLLVASYPLYSEYFKQGCDIAKGKLSEVLKQSSQPKEPAFQWTENLIKHLLEHIFLDPAVKDEALDFLFKLIKDPEFSNNLIQLLVSALQSQPFMKQLKSAVKDILVSELGDVQVRASIDDFLHNLAGNEKIKGAFIQLIQDVFSSKESEQTIVALLKKGVTNQEVKQALSESINFSVREVLADEETLNQLKIFIFFLLRKFENDDQIKGMMDILFAKGLGLVKKKKQRELDKFLKPKKADML